MSTTTQQHIKSSFQLNPAFTSTAVPLAMEHVDTDQIIPARFLKATTREGFGENLFRDWRYANGNADQPNPDFVLNQPLYKGKILVAGKNFGCGSSREHAAWALKDYGFEIVVSSFFADIFKNNALNNFLLPIQISEDFLQRILVQIKKDPTTALEIDLEAQTIALPVLGEKESFELNAYKKMCLMRGLDDIDFLLSIQQDIESFEENHPYHI